MIININPFHLVENSPWPLLASFGALSLVASGLSFFNQTINVSLPLSITITLLFGYLWWRDVHRESSTQGLHPTPVINGLNTGIILFIISEVFFFVSFFWAFFHSSISPTVELGQNWPPHSISPFNPISIPLLNTILLLSSGVTVTWSHHQILLSDHNNSNNALASTIALGGVFTMFQGFEYIEAPFCIADSSFGSTFFIATGFHGLHVLIGSLFLGISLIRFNKIVISNNHIIGFECAAWYWHFVDIVWLFLYSIIYWWGG